MTINRQLGRYELLEQLGEGGMGAVWLARLSGSHGFEKLCIVKTVLPSIAKDADFVSRFLHEGRVLTQLAHGNIAQVLDMNEAEGQLFLALEYVAGVDLARLVDNVRASGEFMPTPLVVALIAQAAEGLGAAHRKTALDGTPLHVVHRDVSPQNIMVSFEGEVKVIDFGIAKSEARSRHTAQASVMGKLGYMAPEQARGENVDHRADQYALAIVLWELLANQPFIRRGTLTEMVVAMAHPAARPLSPMRPDVPPSLEAVVQKALAASPDARYPDTDAFARALTTEVLALGPPPTKPQLGEYVKSKCTREFGAQRQLLTRVSTMRALSSESVKPLSSDPLVATAVRPGPPLVEPAATQELSASSALHTVAARPAAVDAQAMTRQSARPHVAPVLASPSDSAPTVDERPPGGLAGGAREVAGRPGVAGAPDATVAGREGVAAASDATVAGRPGVAGAPDATVAGREGIAAASDATVAGRQGVAAAPDATVAGRQGVAAAPAATVAGRSGVAGSPDATLAGQPGVAGSTDALVAGRPGVAGSPDATVSDPSPTVRERPPGLEGSALGDATVPGRTAVPALVEHPTDPSRPAVVPAKGTPAVLPAAQQLAVPSQPLLGPLTTAELQAALPRRSKAPFVIGGVLLLGVLLAAWVATRPSGVEAPKPPPVAVVADAGQPTVVAPELVVDAGAAPVAIDEPTGPRPADGAITNPPGFDDPPTEPGPDATKPSLRFLVRNTGASWVLTNTSGAALRSCTLTVPGQRRLTLGLFAKNSSREVPYGAVKFDARAEKLAGRARLDCAEGHGVAKF